jgi:hypothetical protein
MPDSGTPGYITINADGTVVTPNNLTPEGVIEAGDLATHADVNAALTAAEDYTDGAFNTATAYTDGAFNNATAYTDASVDGLAPEVDGDGLNVVRGNPARLIAGQYAADIDQPAGSLATFFVDYDFGPDGPPGVWTEWTVVGGLFLFAGQANYIGATYPGGNTARLNFVCTAPAPVTVQGTFLFHIIGTT